jgi:cytochrome-b5 reductase
MQDTRANSHISLLIECRNTQKELDALAAEHEQLKVTYILSAPGPSWTGHRGRVGPELLAATMPSPVEGEGEGAPLVYVCGPPGMMEAVSGTKAEDKSQGELSGLLKASGYSGKSLHFYRWCLTYSY